MIIVTFIQVFFLSTKLSGFLTNLPIFLANLLASHMIIITFIQFFLSRKLPEFLVNLPVSHMIIVTFIQVFFLSRKLLAFWVNLSAF